MSEAGGGVLSIGPGDYSLQLPVLIAANNIAIRGSGPEKTRISWDFGPDTGELKLYASLPGFDFKKHDPEQALPANAVLQAYAHSTDLKSLALYINGERMAVNGGERVTRIGDSATTLRVEAVNSRFGPGTHALRMVTEFTGGGGTAYVGFERSYDCLMQRMTTHNMRHAPNVQWGASGNVIRDSRFYGSDGQ